MSRTRELPGLVIYSPCNAYLCRHNQKNENSDYPNCKGQHEG